MIRLHFVVDGQTEETFVNEVLAPELGAKSIFADVHRITTGRRHGRLFRGGFLAYEHFARDLLLWMKQDQHPESWFTTLVDFYKLPRDFPGQSTLAPNLATQARVRRLNVRPVARRLIPYIQMHEFEALLFSDPSAFLEAYPGDQSLVDRLPSIRARFGNPEDIDDGNTTSPSKRIIDIVPAYQKPVAGILIARRIGLATIRRECGHFNEWLLRLIALAG